MIIKSIRLRLLLWYGLILLLVLAGFGFTAYQLQRGNQFRQIDDELHMRASELLTALRRNGRPPGGGLPRPGDVEGRPPMPLRGQRPVDRPFPGPDEFEEMRGPEDGAPRPFVIPARLLALFGGTNAQSFYYAVWGRDGRELAHATNAPTIPRPMARPGGPPGLQTHGAYREVFHVTPLGEIVLAGRSIAPDLAELNRTAALLAAVGGIILVLGLAGGWWITSRALNPIQAISQTALDISAGNLSRRIDATDVQSELGQLIAVLNSTFSRLESAFEQQRQFTSDAAHELRTPVTVLLTQTQMALNRDRAAPEYKEALETCRRAGQRMRLLTEALLELAKFDAGQAPLNRTKFDLSRTARDCVAEMNPLALEKEIDLKTDLPELPCYGDPDRLAQVLTNLVGNAIQYTHAGGTIRLSGEVNGSEVRLAIQDNGQGISAEDMPRLFKRFFRVDTSRTEGRSGLGLSICQAIMQAHGGRIDVQSEPGKGSCFTIILPRSISPPGTLNTP